MSQEKMVDINLHSGQSLTSILSQRACHKQSAYFQLSRRNKARSLWKFLRKQQRINSSPNFFAAAPETSTLCGSISQ